MVEDRKTNIKLPYTVSVSVITYNHCNYIGQCLDSILMQKTNFAFEIILGEDDSNDGTREICKKYAATYPDLIKLHLRSRKDVIYINGNPTGRFNVMENLKAAKGKYIALCEGDDYWTDPLKLQKQVDFLEDNKDYGVCAHKVLELNHFDKNQNREIPNIQMDSILTIEDYIINNKTGTCSLLFGKKYLKNIPKNFHKLPFGDLGLVLTILKYSNQKMKVFNEVMGVYRVHSGGIHGKFRSSSKNSIKNYKKHLIFIGMIEKQLDLKTDYEIILNQKRHQTYSTLKKIAKQNRMFFTYFYYKFKMDFLNF